MLIKRWLNNFFIPLIGKSSKWCGYDSNDKRILIQALRISTSDLILKENKKGLSFNKKKKKKKCFYISYFDFSFGIKYISKAFRKCGINKLAPGKSIWNIFVELIKILARICLFKG